MSRSVEPEEKNLAEAKLAHKIRHCSLFVCFCLNKVKLLRHSNKLQSGYKAS